MQASWLGYGCTTGLEAIDYFLGARELAPPGARFAERIARLPVPAVYRAGDGMGEPGALPASRSGRVTFGSLSRAVRINARTVAAWAEILRNVAGSTLVVNSGDFRSEAARSSLAARFRGHGIEAGRLSMGHDSPPWDLLRRIDVSLDCFPNNSGTTLYESLYMGVPFVTLADRPPVGRLGSAILAGLGRPEWIATSPGQTVERAVSLAGNLEELAAIRAQLRDRMRASALMDEAAFARAVEAAYCAMWARWSAGEAPADIDFGSPAGFPESPG